MIIKSLPDLLRRYRLDNLGDTRGNKKYLLYSVDTENRGERA